MKDLKSAAKIFDVTGKNRDELAEHLLQAMLNPTDKGEPIPKAGKSKKRRSSSSKGASKPKSASATSKTRSSDASADDSSDSVSSSSSSSSSSDSESESEEEEKEKEKEKEKKSKVRIVWPACTRSLSLLMLNVGDQTRCHLELSRTKLFVEEDISQEGKTGEEGEGGEGEGEERKKGEGLAEEVEGQGEGEGEREGEGVQVEPEQEDAEQVACEEEAEGVRHGRLEAARAREEAAVRRR